MNFRNGPRFVWVIFTEAISVIRRRMTRNKNIGAFIESMIIRISFWGVFRVRGEEIRIRKSDVKIKVVLIVVWIL